tara:strand:+ start:663 stop:1631 length:969 start_codon:yes stop_codon:yes gene_type:complete
MNGKRTIKCILCDNEKTLFFDHYKFNVKSDQNYFGKIDIFKCDNCNLSFCNPMPDAKKLNDFYSNIYRAKGRPHEMNFKNIENELYSYRNLNYIQYLSTFINFNNIKKIFDFGSGIGDLGFLLKKKFKHLNLFSSENDKHCKNILKKREYKLYDSLNEIDEKFDLIISTHSLEHMQDFTIIEKFKSIASPNCYLFLEVPNCDYKNFIERPYDSPHLIFFSKKSFETLSKKFDLEMINLNFASYSIEKSFEYMKNSKGKYENWSFVNKIEQKVKSILKIFVPNIFIEFKKYIFEKTFDKLDYFTLNKKDSWCLRALFNINKKL